MNWLSFRARCIYIVNHALRTAEYTSYFVNNVVACWNALLPQKRQLLVIRLVKNLARNKFSSHPARKKTVLMTNFVLEYATTDCGVLEGAQPPWMSVQICHRDQRPLKLIPVYSRGSIRHFIYYDVILSHMRMHT